jgi:nucleotide-binding universal stress UspA family protein
MTSTAQARPVVVGFDGTSQSRLALDWAVDEAGRRHLPLHLLLARDLPLRGRAPVDDNLPRDPEAEAILAAGLERAHQLARDLLVTTSVRHGAAGPVLVDVSREASLVVVGTRGRGAFTSAMLGSTSIDLTAHAACPVIVVRSLPEVLPHRPGVVVGADGSQTSREAIGQAFLQAAERALPLTVVHAWQVDLAPAGELALDREDARRAIAEAERALAAESVAGWCEKYPDVPVHQHVLDAQPVQALVEHSRGAELVVVGSRGRGGFQGLVLGSVSQGVLQHAHCPVMVVRPTGETNGK